MRVELEVRREEDEVVLVEDEVVDVLVEVPLVVAVLEGIREDEDTDEESDVEDAGDVEDVETDVVVVDDDVRVDEETGVLDVLELPLEEDLEGATVDVESGAEEVPEVLYIGNP